MATKVFAFFIYTLFTWGVFFLISCIVVCMAFDMHPSNPEYETIMHVWRIVCYAMFFPSALVGAYLVHKDWWD